MSDPTKSSIDRPTRIGNYEIGRLISEGGMARVFEGTELLSHRRVAVKVLRGELAHSKEVRARFLAEMKILASLDHANIVRCLACLEWEGRPVMVLELLEGWTLREMLAARQALSWPEVVRYAKQIAEALRAAHGRKRPVVHRDLKPENVIVLPDGRVKVMDFGIAKILQTIAGSTSHAVGTLQYMSPEHIDAKPVDGRSDLFALGLLMWEMLAGRPPFEGASPKALLHAICEQPTPRLPDHVRRELPPHIEALIDALLAKDPAERPANAQAVIDQLDPWTKAAQAPRRVTQTQESAPPINTVELVEAERKRSIGQQVEDHAVAIADEINRFADATSALIVRILVALMILPAAAVGFVGIPFVAAAIGISVVADDGVDVEHLEDPEWLMTATIVVGVLAAVVFVRACWAHRRSLEPGPGRWPWLGLGGLLIACWIATTAIEIGTASDLDPAIHASIIGASFAWLVLSSAWLTGRITSRLFRRLERAPAH